MNWAYSLIIELGLKYDAPIIDLYSTFNKYDSSYYSSISPIEPSNMSGQIITNLIMHIVDDIINDKYKDNKSIYYFEHNDLITIKKKENSLFKICQL